MYLMGCLKWSWAAMDFSSFLKIGNDLEFRATPWAAECVARHRCRWLLWTSRRVAHWEPRRKMSFLVPAASKVIGLLDGFQHVPFTCILWSTICDGKFGRCKPADCQEPLPCHCYIIDIPSWRFKISKKESNKSIDWVPVLLGSVAGGTTNWRFARGWSVTLRVGRPVMGKRETQIWLPVIRTVNYRRLYRTVLKYNSLPDVKRFNICLI